MRLLLIDPLGIGLDVSWRATRRATMSNISYLPARRSSDIGRGLVDIIDDFHPWTN
jgi:hypothetical protein